MVYLYAVTFVLFFYSSTHSNITAWVFIPHALIVLFLYFKNNKRNGRMFSTLKEYVDVTRVDLLATPYKNLLNFTCLIIVLDAFLWPITFPVKFFFWIFYRIFRLKMRRVKRAILEGDLFLIPEEDEIVNDPFYNFLMREGLYSSPSDGDAADEGNSENRSTGKISSEVKRDGSESPKDSK